MNAYDCCHIQNMWRFGIHIGYGWMKIMNVKFPVWIIYKKGCYSLFRLVMDFGYYYCHFLRFTSPNVWKWCIDSNEFCLSRCYWGRLEFTMRYEKYFIVEGIMVTSRWRTTIKALFHCFVFHVLIGILSRVHLLPSTLAKGYDSGPPSLHPWQI